MAPNRRNSPKGMTQELARDDFSLLSAEDKAKIEEEAQLAAEGDLKERQIAAFKKQALHKARVAAGLAKEVAPAERRTIVIDCAGHADRITLDHVTYFQGMVYTVSKAVFDTINEIMARTWIHENEIGGANRDHYRKPSNPTISGKQMGLA